MRSPKVRSKLGFAPDGHYNVADILVWADQARRLPALTTPPRPERDDLNPQSFDRLLDWLNPDREKAGDKYEFIRRRLMKLFVCWGASAPEELADITINRVARKLPEIQANYVGEPARYFLGVARNVFKEALKKERPLAVGPAPQAPFDEDEERDYACLEKCMAKLPLADRDLALSYYQEERRAKIDHRHKLATQWGLSMNALRIKACRIRADLLRCVEQCRVE